VHVELTVAASVEQDVLGLDVTVDVAMPMHAVQDRRQPRHDHRDLRCVERPAPPQIRREALGTHMLHHEIGRVVGERAVIDDGHDARVENASGDLDLAPHPAHQVGIASVGRPEHLDDDPLQRGQALGLEDDPGPPPADRVPNAIATIQEQPPKLAALVRHRHSEDDRLEGPLGSKKVQFRVSAGATP
jgi:hypothetical protein